MAEDINYESRIMNYAKRLGIKDKTVFWGGRDKVSDKKKFELLARAHVMVNPSIREGWGLVNIEANAVGTPVVAYKSPGLVDSVQDGKTGIICKENSPESLAKEISDLLSDKTKLERMKAGARKWAESFSWNKSKKLSLDLINSVVK